MNIEAQYDEAVKAHAAIASRAYDEGFDGWDDLDAASGEVSTLERQLPSTNNPNSIMAFLR